MSSLKNVSYLPYDEPDILTILIQSSFLLLLNSINHIFDNLIFCGLIGQIFVGVAWGTPGGKLLNENVENVVTQLGYLGLILLVYEGGLQTTFKSLKANAVLSCGVAATGVGMPMALSFALQGLVDATPQQAFTAGAALCSTSLGTTFTILSTSGMSTTRLGTVLTTAAMMDDVVGLVMVQVITNLGSSEFEPITVVRPIVVSIGFVIGVLVICRFIAKPITVQLNVYMESKSDGYLKGLLRFEYTAFVVHTAILLGLVTSSSYAGTSNLFAAYLAGASISWWDSEVPHLAVPQSRSSSPDCSADTTRREIERAQDSTQVGHTAEHGTRNEAATTDAHEKETPAQNESSAASIKTTAKTSGEEVFSTFYATALQRTLKPLFFASIGFAIPITDMFSGSIVWRGIVYTILMLFGKLVTGFWLVRLNVQKPSLQNPDIVRRLLPSSWRHASTRGVKQPKNTTDTTPETNSGIELHEQFAATHGSISETPQVSSDVNGQQTLPTDTTASKEKHIDKPLSLYPAAMLGTAMTARGEIGFLIASLAETTGIFAAAGESSSTGSSEIYLIVTWAIVLCTIIGPLSMGTLVKRVRRLQKEQVIHPGKPDPLGIWGVG